jgi:glycosyltransferase involved in cell wall biosynthesis
VRPHFRAVYVAPAPVTLPELTAQTEPLDGEGPIVVHAPSNPAIKGTAEIVAAMNAVATRRPLRPRVITGARHERVVAEVARADIVIDQLNSENYGILATEAMALGKPVLLEFERRSLASFAQDVPAVHVTAQTLEARLEELCADPGLRARLGQEGASFVRRVHDPSTLGRRLEQIYAHARTRRCGVFEVHADGVVAIEAP